MIESGILLLALAASSSIPAHPLDEEPPEAFVQPIGGTTLELRMLPIPGGQLEVGEESHEIAPFWMSELEITWDLYDVFVFGFDQKGGASETDGVTRPSKPYVSADRGFGHATYPAVSISHRGAEAFCEWLSTKSGRRYRLPTEAEWTWACRARSDARWWFGDDPLELREAAWFQLNSRRKTHPVGQKQANPWGLHDVLGNVAEWVVTAEGDYVLCGGCYSDPKDETHRGARKIPTPAWNANDPQIPKSVWWLTDAPFAGFRILCEPGALEDEAGE